MKISHINITMPPGQENATRAFYAHLLGLNEIPKPEPLRARGGVWFDAGGLDLHVSIDDQPTPPDRLRHFGLACPDIETLRHRLTQANIPIDEGRPAPWKRFFIHDAFGNRIEIHDPTGFRG